MVGKESTNMSGGGGVVKNCFVFSFCLLIFKIFSHG